MPPPSSGNEYSFSVEIFRYLFRVYKACDVHVASAQCNRFYNSAKPFS